MPSRADQWNQTSDMCAYSTDSKELNHILSKESMAIEFVLSDPYIIEAPDIYELWKFTKIEIFYQ